jgi:hypothetical protein
MSWKHRTTTWLVAGALLALPVGATTTRQNTEHPQPGANERDLAPTGKGWGEHHAQGQARRGGGGGGGNGIFYHGGPVMVNQNGTNVYYIWYGNWSGNSAINILTDLANGIGGSSYFNINTTYYDGSNTHVANAVNYQGALSIGAYLGTSLTDSQIQQVVADSIAGRNGAPLPSDTNAVYFVLTSADVTASSGFCTQYCGWHTHGSIGGADIKYSFVGNPDRCPSACEAQTVSPNGNSGADGMASIIAHELEEAVTDPDLNAWYDRRGYENADKCAWTFGSTTTLPGGAKTNMSFGGRDWYIQQNWVNASGGYCATSY